MSFLQEAVFLEAHRVLKNSAVLHYEDRKLYGSESTKFFLPTIVKNAFDSLKALLPIIEAFQTNPSSVFALRTAQSNCNNR